MKRDQKKKNQSQAPCIIQVGHRLAYAAPEVRKLWREVCEFNCFYLLRELEIETEKHAQICEQLEALENGEYVKKRRGSTIASNISGFAHDPFEGGEVFAEPLDDDMDEVVEDTIGDVPASFSDPEPDNPVWDPHKELIKQEKKDRKKEQKAQKKEQKAQRKEQKKEQRKNKTND